MPEAASASLAERIDRSEVDLVVVCAPAGFGKTTLATILSERRQNRALCDAAVPDVMALAKATITALGEEADENRHGIAEARASFGAVDANEWTELARRLWSRSIPFSSAFIFDNLETVQTQPDCVAFLSGLLAARPAGRRVIFCSRTPLARDLARHALPHRAEWVNADVLRMRPDQISELFEPLALGAENLAAIMNVTQGWPIAVLLVLRLAREGRLAPLAMLSHEDTAVDVLIEYLAREYFDSLSEEEQAVLMLAVALPSATVQEAADQSGLSIRSCEKCVRSSPFIQTSADKLHPHPLLRALIWRRYRRDLVKIADRSITESARREDVVRAAEISLMWGQQERAADLLARASRETVSRLLSRIVPLVGELSLEAIVKRPTLWLATIDMRRPSLRSDDLLNEARQVLDRLPPETASRARTEVRLECVATLINVGRSNEASEVLQHAMSEVRDEDLLRELQFMCLAVDSYQGRIAMARDALQQAPPGIEKLGSYTRLLDVVEASAAMFCGNYDQGMMLLEKAARLSRESGFVSRVVINLSNVASEAWLVRDDARFERAIVEIQNTLVPGLDRAWTFYLASASGDATAEPTGYETLAIVCMGHLFAAVGGGAAEQAHRLQLAVAAADRSNFIYLRILARIAHAELNRSRRREILGELLELARHVDIAEFAAGVEAYVAGKNTLGPLGPFVIRRLRAQSERVGGIVVDLLGGHVRRGNQTIDMTGRELALITLLAIDGRVVRRDELCDQIWPELDGDSAANNLKGVVYRVRRKLHDGALLSMPEGYCLGPDAVANLNDAEQTVRRASLSNLTETDLKGLNQILTSLRSRPRGDLLRYEWYVAVDHRLQELFRDTALVLCRDANERHRFTTTIQLATELLQLDGADESALRALLYAYAGMPNISAARRALEEFETVCHAAGDDGSPQRMRLELEKLFRTNAFPTIGGE